MNYKAHYDKLVLARIGNDPSGYSEKHHIKPRSLGGGNEKSNIAKLTAREHFIAHRLLAKMHGGPMWIALSFMSKSNVKSASGVRITSRLYDLIKNKDAEYKSQLYSGSGNPFYGKTFTAEQLKKISGPRLNCTGENHHLYGKKRDKSIGELIAYVQTYKVNAPVVDFSVMNQIHKSIGVSFCKSGKTMKTKAQKLLSQYFRGVCLGEKSKGKFGSENPNFGNGQAISGDKNPMFGKKHKETTKLLISESSKVRIKCPHCDKDGNRANMARWHFNNCKALTSGN